MTIRRYVHSPFTVDHANGIKCSVAEDGKVTITKDTTDGEFDEITVPASLIFKLATMLRATVKVHNVEEIK